MGAVPVTSGPKQLKHGRSAVTVLAVASLIVGLTSVSTVLLPAQKAGAADDVVTNCSSAATPGSLAYEVSSANPGDDITFALSPACSLITLTSVLPISGLTITGPGAGSLAISGGGSNAMFSTNSGTTTISGLTLEDGSDGGSGGGAILNNGGTLSIADCTFSGNTSTFYGGAISSTGSLSVTGSTFSDNSATSGAAGAGAILVVGTATIDSSTFSGNTAAGVAGAIDNQGNLTVTNSTFAGNSTSAIGGGILNNPGTASISNSTFWGNSAESDGAGVYNQVGNTLTLTATILADSSAGGDCGTNGTITDGGYNLDDDGTCSFTGPGDLSDTPSGLDPAGLENNGGPTRTIALEPGSAAIGDVSNGSLCPATDQRGVARSTPCDIGAYNTQADAISSVVFGGTVTTPTVTVSGSGFGTEADLGAPTPAACGATGSDYGTNFFLFDGFGAGQGPGDCIGVIISSYSDSQVTFSFGSGYHTYGAAQVGDAFTMTVLNATFDGTVSFPGDAEPTALVTGPGPNTITPIDTATGTEGTPFAFNDYEPGDIAISPDATTAWVVGVSADAVTPVTLATETVGSSITVGNDATNLAITPDGSTVYVVDTGDNTVTPVDTATQTAATPINVGDNPDAIAITPDGSTAYVTNELDNTVTPIAIATNTAGTPISVGSHPDAIAITPDGSTAYVADTGDDTVTPIAIATNTPGTPISVGSEPNAIAITPNGTTAYVVDGGVNTVTPIDLSDNTPGTPIAVDSAPDAVAITPDGKTAEVVNEGGNDVTPINTATNTAGATIGANPDPWGIAIVPDQGPVAALSVTPAAQGQATGFSASASVAPSSPIVNYAWDFGDGHTANTSGPTTAHTYATSGTYTASVTETDADGTSTAQVFTGQTASANGDPQAEVSATFDVGSPAPYSCTLTGSGSGATNFQTVVSESPSPPASVNGGGTFQTAPAVQLTIPSSVINHFRGSGATTLTVASQSITEQARTAGGGASGAVNPHAETASATNLPKSDTLVANTAYAYATTYNPVTWQTTAVASAQQVNLVPGAISAIITFVIHGTPTSETLACTPPAGIAALDSTTVVPPPPTPTFQVPSPTPPLQNQVSAGTDGGWAATIANTSTVAVTGLSASVSVTDRGTPLTYDLTGMTAAGTSCTSSGSGTVTCSVGDLAAGASKTLDLLVKTGGLAQGTSIIGSAAVTSTNASSQSTNLGPIGVVVVQSGNGTKSVAAPGIALVSSKVALKKAKATVSLTLPKEKIRKSSAREEATALVTPLATTLVSPPPVAVTLESLAPSAEPALCPPTGSLKCEGNIILAVGNFSKYTSKVNPIVAVLKFFYGVKVPTGTVYMLKPNGKTVDKLAACKKSASGSYNTPCVFGKEQILGSAAHDTLYAQDTVYFSGTDPAMGRR